MLQNYPDFQHIYADVSKSTNKTAFAFIHNNDKIPHPLIPYFTIFFEAYILLNYALMYLHHRIQLGKVRSNNLVFSLLPPSLCYENDLELLCQKAASHISVNHSIIFHYKKNITTFLKIVLLNNVNSFH